MTPQEINDMRIFFEKCLNYAENARKQSIENKKDFDQLMIDLELLFKDPNYGPFYDEIKKIKEGKL